jgi:acid phosphatase (class A)
MPRCAKRWLNILLIHQLFTHEVSMKFAFLSIFILLGCSQFALAGSSNVVGPYPAIGSVEEKADIDQLLYYQKIRTPEQCAAAEAEANHSSLETFFGGKYGLLTAAEMKKVNKKLKWLTVKTGAKILYYKTKYARIRPYITHPEVKPCIEPEKSKSYPSGHTTLSRVYARILSVIYPERSALFMKRADEVALNRIIGGVHHPSDIAAGKRLGDAIAEDYLESGDKFYELHTLEN